VDVVTPEPTLRRDAQLNQQRILAAAAAVVHRDGPHVPMAVVAAAAGVGIGTLYRRYPNREALLDALTRRSFRLVLDNARAAAAWPGTGLDALAHFFGLTIASRGELILPLHGGPDLVTDATRSVRDEVHRTLQEIVDRGRRDGTVRADATTRDVVYFGALLAQPLAAAEGWDDIAHRLKQVYVDGLAARSG
jgi:AcrR family transcriptional regulator